MRSSNVGNESSSRCANHGRLSLGWVLSRVVCSLDVSSFKSFAEARGDSLNLELTRVDHPLSREIVVRIRRFKKRREYSHRKDIIDSEVY